MAVPIALTADITDQVILEDAQKTKKFYLSRYQLVRVGSRYKLSLEKSATGGSLSIDLEAIPAPEIAEQVREASKLDIEIAIILRYKFPGGGEKELVFQELSSIEGGSASDDHILRAVLRTETLDGFTELFNVLTIAQYEPTLVVRRSARVAIPFMGFELGQAWRVVEGEEWDGTWTRRGTSNTLDAFWRHRATGQEVRDVLVFESLRNNQIVIYRKGTNGRYRGTLSSDFRQITNGMADWFQPQSEWHGTIVAEPTFREVLRPVDQVFGAPLFPIPSGLYEKFPGGITSSGSQNLSLIRHQVGGHSYYQDPIRKYVFYHLPDYFKIARWPKAPRSPMVSVLIENSDPSEEPRFAFRFVAAPVVDQNRLASAATELLRQAETLPDGITGPVFEQLLVDSKNLQLTLSYPRASNASQPEELKLDLRTGIGCTLSLSQSEFQDIWDALCGAGGAALLFQGQLQASLGQSGDNPEPVPLILRINDLAGDLFDYEEVPDTGSGGIQATLQNAIESPVRIKNLTAVLRRGESAVQGTIGGVSFGQPVELKPLDTVTFTVRPQALLAGQGSIDAVFDLSDVEVMPDLETILAAVFASPRPEYTTYIDVKVTQAVFANANGHQDGPIAALLIELEGGNTVELTPDKLTAEKIAVRIPLSDLLLHKVTNSSYRYRVTAIRGAKKFEDRDWRVDQKTVLYPTVEV
ncbi:MAG: hypothetical protein MRJ68_05550 [Nitrospira sp.]|nr:hypothetical protein [Nitrospira sp.]